MVETCDECGFDGSRWATRDAATLLGALGMWWRLATDGIGVTQLNQRPAPAVWSALEYGVHSSLVTAVHRVGIEMVLADENVVFPDFDEPPDAEAGDDVPQLDPAAVIADIAREGSGLADIRVRDEQERAKALLLHAAHDASHHMYDVARGLAALGVGTPRHAGRVVQVNASNGGVPKHSVGRARIGHDGLDVDRQRDQKHHGRPFQALCLWSQEVIDELHAAGHDLAPGHAGENITVAGLDWPALRPGTLLRVGTALAEISFVAVPCAHQARWFSDGDFTRIAHENNPQWVRWYAWVRAPGEVHDGDDVVVRP